MPRRGEKQGAISSVLSTATQARVTDVFKRLDRDHDGSLDAKEFYLALQAMDPEATPQDAEAVIRQANSDRLPQQGKGKGRRPIKQRSKTLGVQDFARTFEEVAEVVGNEAIVESQLDNLENFLDEVDKAQERVLSYDALLLMSAFISVWDQNGAGGLDGGALFEALEGALTGTAHVGLLDLFGDEKTATLDLPAIADIFTRIYRAPSSDAELVGRLLSAVDKYVSAANPESMPASVRDQALALFSAMDTDGSLRVSGSHFEKLMNKTMGGGDGGDDGGDDGGSTLSVAEFLDTFQQVFAATNEEFVANHLSSMQAHLEKSDSKEEGPEAATVEGKATAALVRQDSQEWFDGKRKQVVSGEIVEDVKMEAAPVEPPASAPAPTPAPAPAPVPAPAPALAPQSESKKDASTNSSKVKEASDMALGMLASLGLSAPAPLAPRRAEPEDLNRPPDVVSNAAVSNAVGQGEQGQRRIGKVIKKKQKSPVRKKKKKQQVPKPTKPKPAPRPSPRMVKSPSTSKRNVRRGSFRNSNGTRGSVAPPQPPPPRKQQRLRTTERKELEKQLTDVRACLSNLELLRQRIVELTSLEEEE